MVTCPECRGEGKVKSKEQRSTSLVIATIILVCVLTALPLVVFKYGQSSGREQMCPPVPAIECPKPKCLTELPSNCGRIGDEKIVCTRDNGDRLKIGVFTVNSGPYDPVVFYSEKELVEKLKSDEVKDAGP